ncbi:MAG: hypothetical protein ACX931_02515 [Saccharospirillum sp.]
MDYCNYHPLEAATYHCPNCHIDCCDACVDDSDIDLGVRCLKCRGELRLLPAEHRVPPFWRRLQEGFRYPLTLQTLVLIASVSVITTLTSLAASAVIVAFIINLAATGIMLKYSFLCLQQTARGNLTAPEVADAYQGGIALVFRLLLMLVLMGGAVFATAVFVHPSLGALLGVYFVMAFPASLIQFAISEDLVAAFNPVNSFRLIWTIGLPYGVLIALILVMIGSVGVIQQLIGFNFTLIALSLQSMVSNYYLVVVFHLMGYMLFQYQARLGYSARADDEALGRSQEAVALAHLDILLKEGRYEALIEGYRKALAQFPQSKTVHTRYFEFLTQARNPQWMADFAETHLRFLHEQGHGEVMGQAYRTTRTVVPDFRPASPDLRLALARDGFRRDDVRGVVRLLNGLHRTDPDFPHLPAALALLADALALMPETAGKADACRALAKRIQQRRETLAAAPEPEAKPAPVRRAAIAPQPADAHSAEGIGPPKTLELADNELDGSPSGGLELLDPQADIHVPHSAAPGETDDDIQPSSTLELVNPQEDLHAPAEAQPEPSQGDDPPTRTLTLVDWPEKDTK